MNTERGQVAADIFAFAATILMAYGAFWLAFEFFYPPDESILADGVAVVRGAFIDALGPTRGSTVFLVTVLVLGIILNVVVYLLDSDMEAGQCTAEGTDEAGGA